MSKNNIKQRYNEENRTYKEAWKNDYLLLCRKIDPFV